MVSISLAAIACIRSLINPVKILVGIGDVLDEDLGCTDLRVLLSIVSLHRVLSRTKSDDLDRDFILIERYIGVGL